MNSDSHFFVFLDIQLASKKDKKERRIQCVGGIHYRGGKGAVCLARDSSVNSDSRFCIYRHGGTNTQQSMKSKLLQTSGKTYLKSKNGLKGRGVGWGGGAFCRVKYSWNYKKQILKPFITDSR